MSKTRRDIQALRGWAVLVVLLDHAGLGPFVSGYLGVDIFFVISGFLITKLVSEGIADARFSFRDFYFRRAKRLLPAAYATILATIVGAVWFLGSLEMKDLTLQVVGAVTFTSNVVMFSQTDYFAGAAELKPLLHMWSLAVEEQYYLLLPALLFFLPARTHLRAVLALLVLSAMCCAFLLAFDRAAAFYFLPSRAWELLIGSVGALAISHIQPRERFFSIAFWPALAAVALLPVCPSMLPHPGIEAAAVCFATFIVIVRNRDARSDSRLLVPLARLGDISYSLYLVHWPVIAFLNNAHLAGEPPTRYRALAVLLSFLLACVLYFLVENPVRHAKLRPSIHAVLFFAAASAAMVAVQFGLQSLAKGKVDYAEARRPNTGLHPRCDSRDSISDGRCRNSERPEIMVWGDSYAMHLVYGLARSTKQGVVQATFSSCGPLLGLAQDRQKDRDNPRAWAVGCLDFNKRARGLLDQYPTVKNVVLSANFRQYTTTDGYVWSETNGSVDRKKSDMSMVVQALRNTISAIKAKGMAVTLIGPTPYPFMDKGLCAERKRTGKVVIGELDGCDTSRVAGEKMDRELLKMLEEVARSERIAYINLYDHLCDKQNCFGIIDGISIYRDSGHLSYAGSEYLMKKLNLFGGSAATPKHDFRVPSR